MKHLRHQAEPGTERRQQPSGSGRRGFLRQAGLAAIVVGGLETLGISQATAGTTGKPRAGTTGKAFHHRLPEQERRGCLPTRGQTRTGHQRHRGQAGLLVRHHVVLLSWQLRLGMPKPGVVLFLVRLTHAMANMVAPRAHGVIAQLTCIAPKPCNVHALTSAWPLARRRRREQARTWPACGRWFYWPPRGGGRPRPLIDPAARTRTRPMPSRPPAAGTSEGMNAAASLSRHQLGADRGQNAASGCSPQLATARVSPRLSSSTGSAAVRWTCWLSMVRRRSTVRFLKGAPRSEVFFARVIGDLHAERPPYCPHAAQLVSVSGQRVSVSCQRCSPSALEQLLTHASLSHIEGTTPIDLMWRLRFSVSSGAGGWGSLRGCRR